MAQFPARASPGHPVAHPSPPGSLFPSQPQPQRHERGRPPPAGPPVRLGRSAPFGSARARGGGARRHFGSGRSASLRLRAAAPGAASRSPGRGRERRGREGGRGREGERLAEEEGSGWDPGCGSLRSPQQRQRPPPPAPPPPASVRKDALSPGL